MGDAPPKKISLGGPAQVFSFIFTRESGDWCTSKKLTSCKRFDNYCYHPQCIAKELQ